ncbi:MAG: hypothetical protein GX606_04235 [Elusimicrobia bacterium]|nr:hypothetical protein [Elusimicrobiota bacterium]
MAQSMLEYLLLMALVAFLVFVFLKRGGWEGVKTSATGMFSTGEQQILGN